ncbi:MAG: acyltransferase family protein [Gemmataceae bacterium]
MPPIDSTTTVLNHPGLLKPRSPRYPSLDMWRGLACLLVLINHSTHYHPATLSASWAGDLAELLVAVAKRLWIGVPIFFVISGYCISAAADSARHKNNSLATYFYRRFRRIFPPYWVVLITSIIAVGLVDYLLMPSAISQDNRDDLYRPWWYSPWQWFGNVTLTEIWRPYFVGNGRALFLGQAWTLCYEEQFYAVTGLLLLLAPRRFFGAAAVMTILVGIVMSVGPRLGIPIEGFFFDGLWIQFALGVLVYYQINYASKKTYWLGVMLLLAGLVYSCSEPGKLLDPQKNWNQSYLAAFSFALAILALHRFDGVLMRMPALKPIRICGVMCYSLYLVHVPVVGILHASLLYWNLPCDTINPWITMPVYSAAALAASWGFYLLVERRFVNRPERAASRASA